MVVVPLYSEIKVIDGKGHIIFDGTTEFNYNKASNGGAIDASNTKITFNGNTTFLNNTCVAISDGSGGSDSGGGGISLNTGIIELHNVTTFISNSAKYGGGIYSLDGRISLRGTTML